VQPIERLLGRALLAGLDLDRRLVVTLDPDVAERVVDLELRERAPRRLELEPRALDER
jgi:hypothetical protein